MSYLRRSYSLLIKVKSNKKGGKLGFIKYFSSQMGLAEENGNDPIEVFKQEYIYYGKQKIKVFELEEHIKKSVIEFLDNPDNNHE